MKCLLLGSTVLMVAALSAVATPTKLMDVDTSSWPTTYLSYDMSIHSTRAGAEKAGGVASSGQYNMTKQTLGWDYLRVSGVDKYGGFLEGYLTAQSMVNAMGDMDIFSGFGTCMQNYIQTHYTWMESQVSMYKAVDQHWTRIGFILEQVEGIMNGFNTANAMGNVANFSRKENVTLMDIFCVNLGPEIGDIMTACQIKEGVIDPKTTPMLKARRQGEHCSALVKPTHDDLFVAHDTWSSFYGMNNRIFKHYRGYNSVVAMSSYAGSVSSGDDWYQIQNRKDDKSDIQYFAVQETTNEVFNTSLYTAVVPQTVSEFIRVMSANYQASTAEQWTDLFARHNSGTYNNQYMIVHFNMYAPGSTIPDNTMWIAEQIPGHVARLDVSHVLRDQGYWASYNIPYDKYIYDVSGYAAQEAIVGNFWSYEKYARPEIFRRNNTYVTDLPSMMHMMRYNNYETDKLSLIPNCTGATNNMCNPSHSSMLTVASRGDLMKVYPTKAENVAAYGPLYSFVAQGCFGAIDSKIASYKGRFNMTSSVVNGPTNDQQSTFSWGTGACPAAQDGYIQTFDFNWVNFIQNFHL